VFRMCSFGAGFLDLTEAIPLRRGQRAGLGARLVRSNSSVSIRTRAISLRRCQLRTTSSSAAPTFWTRWILSVRRYALEF
jgi:hypothetical protein